ncbi:efflux RND transporter periplasmic adaptor subunit [Tepidamorphus sp. 3E244]|uniref:efflux RND transporter periplasmic adaptor subunit n=1 Tax=Tepidamorphus sp. 3E244 TaxID=3385498 RepID=UPI0038FC7D7E
MNFSPENARPAFWRSLPHAVLTLALIVSGAAPALAQAGGPGAGARGPAKVGVVEMSRVPVPYTVTVPGRAIAADEVEIRPRVDGLISKIHYQVGEKVAAGDPLFSIEDDVYQAEVLAAEAMVESATSTVGTAQSKVDRYAQILQTGITATEFEAAQAELASAKSSLSTAEANLKMAHINLDRTTINAPIDGVVGLASVSVGEVVTTNQSDALTTVTRLDPVHVDIAESSVRILRNRERLASGAIKRGETIDLRLTLENGVRYEAVGTFVAPGISVSSTTGTQTMRVSFPNPDRKVLPGQFLRVDTTLGTTQAILVPQGATTRTGNGTLQAFVVRDGKAERVQLTETGSHENAWIVTGGVEDGDLLIVDGLTGLQPGAEVETVAVTISPDGVVSELPAPDESTAAAQDQKAD